MIPPTTNHGVGTEWEEQFNIERCGRALLWSKRAKVPADFEGRLKDLPGFLRSSCHDDLSVFLLELLVFLLELLDTIYGWCGRLQQQHH